MNPWRLKCTFDELASFIEWLADQPCKGNGSGQLCRVNAPHDPEWCCHVCRAWILKYGVPDEAH